MDIVESNGQNAVAQGSRTLNDMPEEILEIVRMQQSPIFLDRLSAAALIPRLTLDIFIRFPTLFADTSARWLGNGSESKEQKLEVIAAFARVLPLAPSLSIFLQKYLRTTSSGARTYGINCLSENGLGLLESLSRSGLQQILLATFRLLNFDLQTHSSCVSGTTIQSLFQHADRAVRYLAVRIFCQLTIAADFTLESMIETHVGRLEAVMGDYDGRASDYGFLSLWEQDRLQEAQDSQASGDNENEFSNLNLETLSPLVARYSRVLLPRPNGLPNRPSTMVLTATTAKNMEAMAESLLGSSPILLHGLAGSGKTSLVNDFARELGVDSRMVTLHLNEQTDAKMLIGMYATGSKPGSFTWRAGVLTTAVREGRWVFIEDLDRAPNEVISVILPLIERGELLIPSRGETIKAGPGFKLLASMRTSLSVSGQESSPALHMLGARLWHRVHVQMPSQDEFREIIAGTNPILHKYLPGIIAVYERLYALSHKPSFASKSRTSLGRPISPRDLLKWCRRLESVLTSTGSKTGTEPISEATQYDMFLEATDCFASNLQTDDARRTIIACIAEEMHIDPQRVDHFMTSHVPRYEDLERQLIIGRARLSKRSSGRITKPTKKSRPFANTTHAKRLLEQVGVAIQMSEPVLLVGETGIGKTTVVQQLADSLGYKLTAVNLSQQSEVGDLLGGFKPVNVRSLAIPLKEEFDDLFASTGISTTKNQKYLEQLGKCVAKSQWNKASRLWREAPKMFESIVATLSKKESINGHDGTEQPTKRRKTESKLQSILKLKPRWNKFSQNLDQFDIQLSGGSKGFAFTFVEGNIVKAARNGDWVLLDEINLASPDTLESIADLLHSGSGNSPSILLSETGEIERIRAHPNFRIFGAMNPATDVGKRDLPMGLRTRFTEIYVESPDKDLNDLMAVIKAYIKGSSSNDERAASDVARLYMNTKRLADEKRLVDGANQVPHYSLRTLTRVLSYVNEISPLYGLRRALYEGFAMGFLTLLNGESETLLVPLINHHLLESHGNPQALLSQTPRHPEDGYEYVRFMNKNKDRQYWMLRGSEALVEQPHYIITPFVERNMLNLVRATSTRRFPVLVQGPTSSGKTSMIEYLAKFSGNKFVRINNHEHTDLQEYLGTYISTSDGQLRFQEGLLVQALRQGHWIVLDELNLAPTDVLEALNRLLDDNRELLIPETQEIVRPHPHFMLFATQNPPGLYGGRKTLSRAFRNRFLELHFDDIPENELDFILEKRSQKVAPSDCRRIVSVYKELSRLRQSNRLFEQKDSFATLRDLFRWALRDADNREQLAANGYMLLAERVRNTDERQAVKEIIEKVFKTKIDEALLYSAKLSSEIQAYDETANTQGVVWTSAMRRLYVLVSQALRNNEPVLLVGETGCGKTTVCQMLADAFKKDLNIINAHQNTETGDLIGAQRPVRNRAAVLEQLQQDIVELLNGLGSPVLDSGDIAALIDAYRSLPSSDLAKMPQALLKRIDSNQIKAKALFEWSDGSLVQAMKEGQFFLLDEISLADDSVLERLNSVLESQRSILLAEKGVEDSFVQAADGFQFFATMNPGGDYGKRELSPALRNRFTEIWVPSLSEHDDVLHIVEAKLDAKYKQFGECVVRFSEWFGRTYRSSSSTSVSVRDVLAWVAFINSSAFTDPYVAVMHGAAMVFIDTMGANPAALLAITPDSIREERIKCLQKLGEFLDHDVTEIYFRPVNLVNEGQSFTMGDFTMTKNSTHSLDSGFAFDAPTTKLNGMRVIRALQVRKPILIEGNPGVGKTTLIAALARACGKPLTRINLSEQTDLMDLFGSDVPVEGAEVGHFAWRDAPFLQAMQKGEWVLLDEMNLASQSVLEGLNACLDHRGEVYVSELDQTFRRHPNFAIFAAQNPHHQGGGRKGLPSSFVNRFTVVYADVFSNDDLELICRHNFPTLPQELMMNIIRFVSNLEQEVARKPTFGSQGGPWEFNLRDILRWLQMLTSQAPLLTAGKPSDFLDLIFRLRFRTSRDRDEVRRLFTQVFGHEAPFRHLFHNISSEGYQVGMAFLLRDRNIQRQKFPPLDINNRLAEIESIISCIQHNLPCILVGPSGSGKTTLLQHVAATSGKSFVVFPLNADIDTMDLVGGFEQVDPQRAASRFLEQLSAFLKERVLSSLPGEIPNKAIELLELLSVPRERSAEFFMQLSSLLLALEQETSLSEFAKLAQTCEKFASQPMSLENARFEWVDGVLIRALEEGKWLVLDNANLCSASVLDRLNSLLEPNGFLIINEHCGPDGKPKIAKPHPDFRIFLTMDSRFGELSRAMRNRAIEIFLEPLPQSTNAKCQAWARAESAMQRYQTLSRAQKVELSCLDETQRLNHVALSNLAWSDIPLLTRYASAFQFPEPSVTALDFGIMCRSYVQLHEGEANQSFREAMGNLFNSVAAQFGLSAGFRDAQILHPFQNSPLVPLLESLSPSQIYSLGSSFDLRMEIYAAIHAYRDQGKDLQTLKPSGMNRLQRSLVRASVSAVNKDSTIAAANFLQEALESIGAFEKDGSKAGVHWKVQQRILSALLQYWWDTYHLVTSSKFEEATFQAHIAIGEDMFKRLIEESHSCNANFMVLFEVQKSLHGAFTSGFKLTTGLSMERLWKHLRPVTVSRLETLNLLTEMQELANRFDKLRWNTLISISELGAIFLSFVKAYRLILTSEVDGVSLVKALGIELEKVESSMSNNDGCHSKPFFVEQFEALRQTKTLKLMQNHRGSEEMLDLDTLILSDHSAMSEMRLSSSTTTSRHLKSIEYLLGAGNELKATMHTLSSGFLLRLNEVEGVNLWSLKLLESELPLLGQKIASSTDSLAQSQFVDLNSTLLDLIAEIRRAHDYTESDIRVSHIPDLQQLHEDASIRYQEVVKSPHETANAFHNVNKNYFQLSVMAASERQPLNATQYSAYAWINFAIGALTLYVPDKAFDPDKRQRLERGRHLDKRENLFQKLAALRRFEQLFTGQDSNLRCQLLETEIEELGEPQDVLQEIYRPEVSELHHLQGEFNSLLKSIVQSDQATHIVRQLASGDFGFSQEISLIQSNIRQVIRRLSERFKGYGDITDPVVSMLRCLQLGLFMAASLSSTSSTTTESSTALSGFTPFLGGDPAKISEDAISDHPIEYLGWLSTVSTIEDIKFIDDSQRQRLLKTFHVCFEEWIKKLESDRQEAESKSGLYRFRGSEEDEEEVNQEELNQLFPEYNAEDSDREIAAPTLYDARDSAVKLAKLHSTIFIGHEMPSDSIKSLVKKVAIKVGTLHNNSRSSQSAAAGDLLPGSLLLLDDHVESLKPTATVSESYNFYADANLPECRNLVALIHQIQARFCELQNVDEIGHMQTLEDVLVSCRELLLLKHTEPLAKIIVKVEKIHAFMHEWQFGGWASKIYTAPALYDRITATIVSWRRLELSTWAKLFDMESEKCEDDARSWWFVAYQVIVAAPLAISESADQMHIYAQKLLKDLESYFNTAIMGQFAQRLQLLKQFQQHLEILALDAPNMAIINAALTNFIALFARYQVPVKNHLKKGRISLEKAMRDILLLASWKDTNIVALRDSAKRSHHKLFKVVRKFRSLLGQPMEIIIKSGLPDQKTPDSEDDLIHAPAHFPSVDLNALALCASSVPKWSGKSKRFINVSKTVSMMADSTDIADSAVNASKYLDSFIGNVIISTEELQKATPSTMTEDNKDTVKHLKNRKRKLLADTLKELRQMGIKYNLGADALAQQDSLALVLARIEPLLRVKEFDFDHLEYYFHKAIDLAPRAREVVRQHSEDLSSAEVLRSTGFLEGLLQVVLNQQVLLSKGVASIQKLDRTIKMSGALWAPTQYHIKATQTLSNHAKQLRWLPNILKVASDLIEIHGRLGKIDNDEIGKSISGWVNTFNDLDASWSSLPQLPFDLTSTQVEELERRTSDSLSQLMIEISQMSEVRPDLTIILNQISLWTKTSNMESPGSTNQHSITDLDAKISTVCDTVLVAIEKYKKSIIDLPSSTEEANWLVRHDSVLVAAIKSLHCEEVVQRIEETFEILRNINLDDEKISEVASALFAVALPIFQQYFNTLQDAVIRYADLNRATCKVLYILSKTFIQIATQGFCTPSEKSNAQDGQTEKLEGGTGLGDGEGAEDISKDIQDDENLDELAQEPNEKSKDEIEDEKDAVDMADGEMEGEMGETEEKGEDEEGSGDEESGDEMDEEAGDADDLDPNAVDEKMWDGDKEEAEKDQEGDDAKGKKQQDEQVAAQDSKEEANEGDDGEEEEDDAMGAEQGEEVTQQDEAEKHDPHAEEGETLDLPEDMELDGDEKDEKDDGTDDGVHDMSDIEDAKDDEEVKNDGKEEPDEESMDPQESQQLDDEMDVVDLDEDQNEEGQDTEQAGDKPEETEDDEQEPDEQEGLLQDRNDEANPDAENAVPSDLHGIGEDQDKQADQDKTETTSKAQRDDGGKGGDSSEQKDAAAEDGEKGRQANGDAPQDASEESQDSNAAQPFKKLGDALESWHRQQTKIREAAEEKEKGTDQNMNMDTDTSDFQHLQDEEAEADTQAMGTATEEQAHALDESMAIDEESSHKPDQFQPDEIEDPQEDVMDFDDPSTPQEQDPSNAYEGQAGATINQAKQDRQEDLDERRAFAREDFEEDVDEVDNQLESTHLDSAGTLSLRSAVEAREQWSHYEALTRDLSLSLTEQLRLILAPTLATKMRGDFRTGKRLNIKRIIPYIASQYKRDKIWMRRSVPSKRSYQIMLAVDDSKSMGESGSGSLAFETLVMVSKSLSMLEVGEICVVGFGEHVKVAHEFDAPFSSDAGPKVFQNFGFEQKRTDVTKLVRESIELFRTARTKASSSPADLWQVELIISDGVCDSSEHEPIRRLLREALEERIMMVFVIVDDLKNKKKGESVMDLQEAKFVKNEMTGASEVKIERYLDTFPFQYYLVVSDVKELPSVLATLLRQWFAEVVDSGS